MSANKATPSPLPQYRPGTEAFEVEWCEVLPATALGEANLDEAIFSQCYRPTKTTAMLAARAVYHRDKFGAVRITPVRWEDRYPDTEIAGRIYRWVPIGDSVEFSGGGQ